MRRFLEQVKWNATYYLLYSSATHYLLQHGARIYRALDLKEAGSNLLWQPWEIYLFPVSSSIDGIIVTVSKMKHFLALNTSDRVGKKPHPILIRNSDLQILP
jgi:hypothetical protein